MAIKYQRAVRVAAASMLLFCVTARCRAWGREGHRLVALVAEHYLTPETKAQVAALLSADSKSKETLADVAPWADEYRESHPETAAWHFVDIPLAQAKFDRNRDCPVSSTDPKSPWRDCVTDRILYFEGRLGDAGLSDKERAIALKFLVHLIGDIHQPFHTVGDDRGGNGVAVGFLGSNQCDSYHCNLHSVWDDTMIQERNLSEAKYVGLLLKDIDDNQWQHLAGGEPTTWANLSHQYAINAAVPNGAMLSREYYDEEIKVVDSQLALAGLRLARVLNRVLAPAPLPVAQPGVAPVPAPQP